MSRAAWIGRYLRRSFISYAAACAAAMLVIYFKASNLTFEVLCLASVSLGWLGILANRVRDRRIYLASRSLGLFGYMVGFSVRLNSLAGIVIYAVCFLVIDDAVEHLAAKRGLLTRKALAQESMTPDAG